jgi:DNA polymerase III subunit delta'
MNSNSVIPRLDRGIQGRKLAIYPWQITPWTQLNDALAQDRLPHALLINGTEGIGKNHFCEQFAHRLLCTQPTADGFACGQCPDCLLVQAGTHPDFTIITTEEKSKIIKVDQIRSMIHASRQTAQRNKRKIILVTPADVMNVAASNALLKTLEEPCQDTYLFLVTHQMSRLLPTIKSRCHKMSFTLPNETQALAWLKEQTQTHAELELALSLAHGAPLRALDAINNEALEARKQCFTIWVAWQQKRNTMQDVLKAWGKHSTLFVMNQWVSWLCDLIKVKQGLDQAIVNQDFAGAVSKLAARLNLQRLYQYYDRLLKARQWILAPQINVNETMQLEALLVEWVEVWRC